MKAKEIYYKIRRYIYIYEIYKEKEGKGREREERELFFERNEN